jgi:hypothetical protein
LREASESASERSRQDACYAAARIRLSSPHTARTVTEHEIRGPRARRAQHEECRREAAGSSDALREARTMFAATAARPSAEHEVATAERDGEAEHRPFLALHQVAKEERGRSPTTGPGAGHGPAAWRTTRARRRAAVVKPLQVAVWLECSSEIVRGGTRSGPMIGSTTERLVQSAGVGRGRGDYRWPRAPPGTEDDGSTKGRRCEAEAVGTTERRARTPVRGHRSKASTEYRRPRLKAVPTLPCPARGRQEGTSAATDHERWRGAGRRGAEKRHPARGG